MRELDVVLTSYLELHYATSAEVDKQAFRELLALPDPELNAYLLGVVVPSDIAIAHVVALLRSQALS